MKHPRKRVNILWLDDMLEQEPQWFDLLKKHVERTHGPARFLQATRIESFAEVLKSRSDLGPNSDEYIDWIWLDVKIKHYKRNPTFEAFGFGDVPQNPLLVGAQILELMQYGGHFNQQVAWLASYRGRRTSLLTTLLDIRHDWRSVVSPEVRARTDLFSALVKHLKYGNAVVEPDQAFTDHVSQQMEKIRNEWSSS
jgi:hypothetical protein